MDQTRIPLLEAIQSFQRENKAYFCIPGHRGTKGVHPAFSKSFGDAMFQYDLTEAEGLDDLHHAEGAIKEAQELASELYGADRTWFLVNGTTCGNEAMILSSVFPGEEIIVPRNAHKSVMMGLILSGAKPVWVMPEYDEEHGLTGVVTPEILKEAFDTHPHAKAAFVVSPTYYGICSDLEALAEICHAHDAMLLVDEAHGAHLGFSDKLPKSALQCGADMTAQSTHKTAGSFTQSSMLHVQGRLVDHQRVDDNLKLVMSTSPSYLLMCSLDAARAYMAREGKVFTQRAVQLADQARKELEQIPGIEVISGSDPSRLVFSAVKAGISGYDLKDRLYEMQGISLELADPVNVVAVITGANEESEIEFLVRTVRQIAADCKTENRREYSDFCPREIPEQKYMPREAYFMKKEEIPFENCLGKAAGEMIAPYPPGIPLLYPGEVINESIYAVLQKCREVKPVLHGPKDDTLNRIRIIADQD